MTIKEISALLAAPFADSDIEWRFSSLNKDKTNGRHSKSRCLRNDGQDQHCSDSRNQR